MTTLTITADKLREGLMSDITQSKSSANVASFWQAGATLLAVAIGSAGVTGWGQSGFQDALDQHRHELQDELRQIKHDIDDLRHQVVGSHNLRDIVRVQRAMNEIDRDDSDAWTGDGKPRIYAIEAKLIDQGYHYLKVSAALRDMAWGLRELH